MSFLLWRECITKYCRTLKIFLRTNAKRIEQEGYWKRDLGSRREGDKQFMLSLHQATSFLILCIRPAHSL